MTAEERYQRVAQDVAEERDRRPGRRRDIEIAS